MTSDFDTQKHDSDTSLASDRTIQKTTTLDAQVGFSATSEPSRHSTAELIAFVNGYQQQRQYEAEIACGAGDSVFQSQLQEEADQFKAIKDRLAELQELNESLKLANSDAQHQVRQLEAALESMRLLGTCDGIIHAMVWLKNGPLTKVGTNYPRHHTAKNRALLEKRKMLKDFYDYMEIELRKTQAAYQEMVKPQAL